MAKKAKWLEESTNSELLGMLGEILKGDEPDMKKAQKIVAELTERTPADDEEGMSVEEALAKLENQFSEGLAAVQGAYQAELEAVGDADENEEDDEDEDGDDEEGSEYDEMTLKELKAAAREAGIKVSKGMKREELIAALTEADGDEEEDEEEDDEDAADYEDMSQKELKALCRERGIKVTKSMKKADFIKALEADDEE